MLFSPAAAQSTGGHGGRAADGDRKMLWGLDHDCCPFGMWLEIRRQTLYGLGKTSAIPFYKLERKYDRLIYLQNCQVETGKISSQSGIKYSISRW
jgi:hypothetical protein